MESRLGFFFRERYRKDPFPRSVSDYCSADGEHKYGILSMRIVEVLIGGLGLTKGCIRVQELIG